MFGSYRGGGALPSSVPVHNRFEGFGDTWKDHFVGKKLITQPRPAPQIVFKNRPQMGHKSPIEGRGIEVRWLFCCFLESNKTLFELWRYNRRKHSIGPMGNLRGVMGQTNCTNRGKHDDFW